MGEFFFKYIKKFTNQHAHCTVVLIFVTLSLTRKEFFILNPFFTNLWIQRLNSMFLYFLIGVDRTSQAFSRYLGSQAKQHIFCWSIWAIFLDISMTIKFFSRTAKLPISATWGDYKCKGSQSHIVLKSLRKCTSAHHSRIFLDPVAADFLPVVANLPSRLIWEGSGTGGESEILTGSEIVTGSGIVMESGILHWEGNEIC